LSLVSFFLAILTVIFFCIGFAPFLPMTAPLCYPSAVLTGAVALFSGVSSLRQVRVSGEKGRAMALIGIWTGALSILAVICATTITILILVYGFDYLRTLWPQFIP
jgi:hypothetical protein